MSKLPVPTLISLLLLTVVIGCSSSDQGAIDKAVSATLTAAQPPTATPTYTTVTEQPLSPTKIVYLSDEWADVWLCKDATIESDERVKALESTIKRLSKPNIQMRFGQSKN